MSLFIFLYKTFIKRLLVFLISLLMHLSLSMEIDYNNVMNDIVNVVCGSILSSSSKKLLSISFKWVLPKGDKFSSNMVQ